jgi:hypothetical protein
MTGSQRRFIPRKGTQPIFLPTSSVAEELGLAFEAFEFMRVNRREGHL